VCRYRSDFTGRVISFFEGNEDARSAEILEALANGKNVLIVSDAGMPTISDPGFRVMRDAISKNFDVSVIPGPSAVTMSIALSGLPTDRFTFEGFLPRTSGGRSAHLEKLRFEERTMVFFEAPHRLVDFLKDAQSIFGSERDGAICREMTKRYEEIKRGNLSELNAWASGREILGEITVVIAGAQLGAQESSTDSMVARVREFEGAGMDRKSAIATVAEEFSLPKRTVFTAMVESKSTSKITT